MSDYSEAMDDLIRESRKLVEKPDLRQMLADPAYRKLVNSVSLALEWFDKAKASIDETQDE